MNRGTGTPFGNDRFLEQIEQIEQIEQTLGRKVGFCKRGRPKKPAKDGGKEVRHPPVNCRSWVSEEANLSRKVL